MSWEDNWNINLAKVSLLTSSETFFIWRRIMYFYMKSETDKNQLVPDPYASRVVQDIFRMRLDGLSANKIAGELNRLGILSPMAYKKNHGIPYARRGWSADKDDCKWSATTIIRILQDEVYIGTLVQGKQGSPHFKIKEMEQLPSSEWIRVPDAHEPIIPRDSFELVQRIKGLDTRSAPDQNGVYMFSGLLICGCCGGKMIRKTNKVGERTYHYYYCPTGKKNGCTRPTMLKEETLASCVLNLLKAHIGNLASLEALLAGIDQDSINQALVKEYREHIAENEQTLAKALEYKARLYEHLVAGDITREEYATFKEDYTRKASSAQESIRLLQEKLTDVLENKSERNRWIANFTQFFFATGRTIDTEELVMVTSRGPRYYVSAAYWARDSLLWAFPSVLVTDCKYAKELLLSVYRKQGRNFGIHSRYIDGTVLEPGFELDELCVPVIALKTYVDQTRDRDILKQPVVTERLEDILEKIEERRHPNVTMYSTFLQPTDDMHCYPYLTYDNALVVYALRALGDMLDRPQLTHQAEQVKAAVEANCCIIENGRMMYAWSVNLQGQYDIYDEPPGSLQLLPWYGFCNWKDTVWLNTVAYIRNKDYELSFSGHPIAEIGCKHAPHPWVLSMCNSLLSGHTDTAVEHLNRTKMDNGIACESVNEDNGLCETGAAFATCAGFLSFALLHACGE